MTVYFYDYQGEPITIKKSGLYVESDIYLGKAESLIPYKPLSDLDGEMIYDYDSTTFKANYCVVDFGSGYTKNYFIRDREMLTGSKMRHILHCDVLTTFQSGVLGTNVLCKRTALQSKQSPYMIDTYAPVEARRSVAQQEEGTHWTEYSNDMILITVG